MLQKYTIRKVATGYLSIIEKCQTPLTVPDT